MSGVVFAAMAPHGWDIIPDLVPDASDRFSSVGSMRELARRFESASPNLIVLSTPHNVRIDYAICIPRVARGAGIIREQGRVLEMNIPMDAAFAGDLAAAAREAGLPVAVAGFAGNNPDQSVIPLDWGTMVPLWFLGHTHNLPNRGDVLADPPENDAGPPVVIVSPSRVLDRQVNVAFGEVVADVAAQSGRRVAFIASCDWSHAHKGSRYGEDIAAAEELDGAVVEALKAGDPGRLIDLDERLVARAAIDGLWQALMLAGVLKRVPMNVEFLGYEVAEGFATGMAVAAFTPAGKQSPGN